MLFDLNYFSLSGFSSLLQRLVFCILNLFLLRKSALQTSEDINIDCIPAHADTMILNYSSVSVHIGHGRTWCSLQHYHCKFSPTRHLNHNKIKKLKTKQKN